MSIDTSVDVLRALLWVVVGSIGYHRLTRGRRTGCRCGTPTHDLDTDRAMGEAKVATGQRLLRESNERTGR